MKYQEKLARCLRLMTIRSLYQREELTEEDALELLKGALTPDDPTTIRDDSKFLKAEPEKIFKFFNLTDARTTHVSNLEKKQMEEALARNMFGGKEL